MCCVKCQDNSLEIFGFFEIDDPFVGKIRVQGTYDKCGTCGDVLFTPEIAKAFDIARNELKEKLLKTKPIGEYINASEAASLLGVTRQALNKNRRIRRGFIFQTKISGFTVYLKQSVIQYKKTGDGRFNLTEQTYHPLEEYVGPLESHPSAASVREK